jgi:hypothetical protein
VAAPPRWSAAAIGGFVLSLIGFLGVTAVLGLLFGIIGIVATRGGRRRGMGLAIAAVPISLATGALAILLVFAVLFASHVKAVTSRLEEVLACEPTAVAAAVDQLRLVTSDEFNERVDRESMQGWLERVHATHGKLIDLTIDRKRLVTPTENGALSISLDAKFVNGTVSVRVTFSEGDFWSLRIDDIEVDGGSPLPSD